jgi:hypothetical protein
MMENALLPSRLELFHPWRFVRAYETIPPGTGGSTKKSLDKMHRAKGAALGSYESARLHSNKWVSKPVVLQQLTGNLEIIFN